MFTVNNKDTRRRSSIFIVNFEHDWAFDTWIWLSFLRKWGKWQIQPIDKNNKETFNNLEPTILFR